MTEDWSGFLDNVGRKSDEQLEIELETPDSRGGNAERRAFAKVEIQRRERAAAKELIAEQLGVAMAQAQTAKSAMRAAWASAATALLTLIVPLLTLTVHFARTVIH